MAELLENRALAGGFWLLRAREANAARMGQFYMLRAWRTYPVLSRPISVFDTDGDTLSFLYRVAGKGTARFTELAAGEEIALQGPYGNGFPETARARRVSMVGGGVGIAPLYLAAKRVKELNPGGKVELYLGFSGEAVLVREFERVADSVTVNVGGFITDEVDPAGCDAVFTCGPEAMMRALYEKCVAAGVADRLYASVENRMACGVGACLVCSRATKSGNRRACKDGPVFPGEEVFGL